MEIDNSNNKKVKILIIFLAVVLIITGTYALWSSGVLVGGINNIASGDELLSIKYTEGSDTFNTIGIKTDSEGINSDYFSFTVTGNGYVSRQIKSYIYLMPELTNTLDSSNVKVYLTSVANSNAIEETVITGPVTLDTLDENFFTSSTVAQKILNESVFNFTNGNDTKYYRLRMWIKEDASFNNESFNQTVTKSQQETQSGGTSHDTVINSSVEYAVKVGIYATEYGSIIINGINGIISKVGTDGLVEITHPADNTLQLGSSSPITEYRYQGRNGCQGVTMTEEICTLIGGTRFVENVTCYDDDYNYYVTADLSPAQCAQHGGTYNNNVVNNYVNFNGEDGDYRIIGVFPTDDGSGNIANRIKLIKTTSYVDSTADENGEYYWNTANTNKWGEASLKETLNDTYYNSLTNKGLIDSVKYYLGGYNQWNNAYTNETMYQYERKISGSDYYYSGNPTSWTGQIGLMYASDYMYGSADCNGKVGYNSNSSLDTRACATTNWLYLGEEWTITEYSSLSYAAFLVISKGYVIDDYMYRNTYAARPVQYLSSEAVITGGTGTIENPYTFG